MKPILMVQLLKAAQANDVIARVFVLADTAVDVVSQIGFMIEL